MQNLISAPVALTLGSEPTSLLDVIVAEDRITKVETPAIRTARYRLNLKDRTAKATLISNKRCGSDWDGFYYQLSIETSALDGDGFVVDNRAFDGLTWADRFYVASCEMLAGGLIHAVQRLVGDRLLSVKASVKNNTGNVEIEWNVGEELPPGPREATDEETRLEVYSRNRTLSKLHYLQSGAPLYYEDLYGSRIPVRNFYDPPSFDSRYSPWTPLLPSKRGDGLC